MENKKKEWKIPILYRLERFIVSKREEKRERDAKSTNSAFSRHKRSYGKVCPNCSNEKWFKRKNSIKCTVCGYKIYCKSTDQKI